MLNLYARLTKVDEATRRISGVIASEALDRSREVFDYAASKQHFEAWSGEIAKNTDGKSLGNVRAMHGKVAAGRLTELTFDDVQKTISVEADIVDDNEWGKVLKGVYTGFSIGGKYVRKWADDEGQKRYEAAPHEVSLVDLPCNKDATFTVVKAAGGEEEVHFDESVIEKAEGVADTEQGTGDIVTDDANVGAEEAAAKAADEAPEEGEVRVEGEEVQKFVGGNWTTLGKLAKDDAGEGNEEELRKGAYTIGSLARMAEDCRSLAASRVYEAWDGTSALPKIPDALRNAANALYDALLSVVSEDVDKAKGMIAEKVAGMGDGDMLKAVGLTDTQRADVEALGELRKALDMDNDGLIEAVEKVTQANKALTGELEDLRKRHNEAPAPAKGVVRVVDKASDVELNKLGGSEEGSTATASDDASPEQKTSSELRKALRSGVVMGGMGR